MSIGQKRRKVKKVISALKKASKAHAGQAKTLQSVMKNGKKKEKKILELGQVRNRKAVDDDSILMRIRVILCLSSLLLLLTLGERWQKLKRLISPSQERYKS